MNLKNNKEAKSNFVCLSLKNHSVGKVHSKFNHGLNVQFDDSLIYIGCMGTALSAFGLNIEEEKLKYILCSASVDDMVVNKGDRLVFYSVCGVANIYYKDAEEVNLKLPGVKCSIKDIPGTRLYKYLESIELQEFTGITPDEETGRYIDLLLNSDKTDLDVNSSIVKFFAGRGKGLTPSGDDILLGFTLALMVFGRFDTWIKTLKSGVTKNSTTVISVAYTSALLQGYASEYFIRLVKLIDGAETDVMEKTIREVRSFGHTSGNDTLFGFLLGLKFLTKQRKAG